MHSIRTSSLFTEQVILKQFIADGFYFSAFIYCIKIPVGQKLHALVSLNSLERDGIHFKISQLGNRNHSEFIRRHTCFKGAAPFCSSEKSKQPCQMYERYHILYICRKNHVQTLGPYGQKRHESTFTDEIDLKGTTAPKHNNIILLNEFEASGTKIYVHYYTIILMYFTNVV